MVEKFTKKAYKKNVWGEFAYMFCKNKAMPQDTQKFWESVVCRLRYHCVRKNFLGGCFNVSCRLF